MYLDKVSAICGSGWVDTSVRSSYQFHIFQVDPPATAGGTDLVRDV